jgi:hypothetical protein
MIKRFMVQMALSALLLTSAIVVHSGRAEASWNACPTGRFCMWEHTNYWGVTSFVLYPTGQCLTSPTWVSSVRNNRPLDTYVYTSTNCTTGGWLVNSAQSYSPMPAAIGDNGMRSFRLVE